MLALLVTHDVVKALIDQPIHYINHRVNLTVSNHLFNAIGAHFGFPDCIIGPIDEEKVPADCFEALAGLMYVKSGFQGLRSFWQRLIFALDDKYIEGRKIVKSVEVMKLGLDGRTIRDAPDAPMPGFVRAIIGGLKHPPEGTFTHGSELQQKCKMVGAVFLKAALAATVFRGMRKTDDFMMVDQKAKKENVNQVATQIGFPNGRQLKVFLGGIALVNTFEDVMALIERVVIPPFELFPRRRRRHTREAMPPIPELQ
jgi:hypothetical protein